VTFKQTKKKKKKLGVTENEGEKPALFFLVVQLGTTHPIETGVLENKPNRA
jgi:hypothetical protein